MTRKRPKRWRRWAKRAGVVVLTILMVAIAVSIRWTVSLTRYQQDDLAPVWQSISLSSGAFEANWIGDARSGNIGDLRLSIIAQPAEFRVYPLSY